MFVVFAAFLRRSARPPALIPSCASCWYRSPSVAGLIVALVGTFSLSRYKFERAGLVSTILNAVIAVAGPLFVGALIFSLSIVLDQLLLESALVRQGRIRLDAGRAQAKARRISRSGSTPCIACSPDLRSTGAIAVGRLALHQHQSLSRCMRSIATGSYAPFSARRASARRTFHRVRRRTIRACTSCPRPRRKGKGLHPRQRLASVPRHQHRAQHRLLEAAGVAGAQGGAIYCQPAALWHSSRSYPLAKESGNIGTRPSAPIGQPGIGEQQGISLGTAMAISGAAANPEHGLQLLAPAAF